MASTLLLFATHTFASQYMRVGFMSAGYMLRFDGVLPQSGQVTSSDQLCPQNDQRHTTARSTEVLDTGWPFESHEPALKTELCSKYAF